MQDFYENNKKNETKEQGKSLDDSTGGKNIAIKNLKKKSIITVGTRYCVWQHRVLNLEMTKKNPNIKKKIKKIK